METVDDILTKEFMIIEEKHVKTFEDKIKKYLNRGWNLHGDMIIKSGAFYQAITKY